MRRTSSSLARPALQKSASPQLVQGVPSTSCRVGGPLRSPTPLRISPITEEAVFTKSKCSSQSGKQREASALASGALSRPPSDLLPLPLGSALSRETPWSLLNAAPSPPTSQRRGSSRVDLRSRLLRTSKASCLLECLTGLLSGNTLARLSVCKCRRRSTRCRGKKGRAWWQGESCSPGSRRP